MALANVLFYKLLKVDGFVELLTVDEELCQVSHFLNNIGGTFRCKHLNVAEILKHHPILVNGVLSVNLAHLFRLLLLKLINSFLLIVAVIHMELDSLTLLRRTFIDH